MHGAPIQCTRGKCSKAFHVSCAREGAEHGIVYKELGEVEKDVVLVDVTQVSTPCAPMDIDGAILPSQNPSSDSVDAAPPNKEAIKVVRKTEFQLLCPQHNPLVLEAKKANKQDKIRKDLLALAPMSRIKIRVSAGIFEVSLVRVMEESNSVEVLWDRGIRREFKWGSVVFGNLEGQTIGQKPTEAAPESEHQAVASSSNLPQPLASSGATTGTAATSEPQKVHIPFPPRMGAYPYAIGAWGYHYPPFPGPGVPSVPPGVTQGDSATNIMASGTFPYPYTAVPYAAGQSYVPPIKYPYGAPAVTAPTSDGSSQPAGVTPVSSAAQAQEGPYNCAIQWKQPYKGPRGSTSAAQPQAEVQNQSTPSADADDSTQNQGGVESSITDSESAAPSTSDSIPASTTTTTTPT